MKLSSIATALLIVVLATSAVTEASANQWRGRRHGWHGPRPGYGRPYVRVAPPIIAPPIILPPIVQAGYGCRPYVRPCYAPVRHYNRGRYGYGRGYNRYNNHGYRGGQGGYYRR